jgi:hypothetical protein
VWEQSREGSIPFSGTTLASELEYRLMELRFSPFRRRPKGGPTDDLAAPTDPVPPQLVVREIKTPKRLRQVTVLHPEQAGAYRIKSRLRDAGHQQIETFFLPESFLSVLARGHSPHVVVVDSFDASEAGVTGR